jgi:hypothetical protein
MDTQTALLTLIQQFLERQKLAAAALRDLQPHLLMANSVNDTYFQLVEQSNIGTCHKSATGASSMNGVMRFMAAAVS